MFRNNKKKECLWDWGSFPTEDNRVEHMKGK